ncbi:MAG: metallophosphoesterase [Candidatus Lindowbacteria bacterium RIFCSPLOWO2_12_FULL_62_27]|nr:MAG: metallophosphoesterase [Candidatus Lindowbacteria bacterium RIFCSPLOWO2_12_FULL_62_27]OGH61794.1 MAG: metallophosphoesterase [Candidatus Lindowbacteria bacterium RIFCSPLOWO2_02_FULL_62_12]
MSMKIVLIADTHNQHWNVKIPDGDMIIHAGDMSGSGTTSQVEDFLAWFRKLPHRHKILVAGNHDWLFELNNDQARQMVRGIVYLQDEAAVIGGLKIYGTPWSPWFNDWAFNLNRGEPLRKKWNLISADTDILITHGPPRGIGDLTDRGENTGCADLLEAVRRVKPRLHVFGHIHEGYGVHRRDGMSTIFVNASVLSVEYDLANSPIVLDL